MVGWVGAFGWVCWCGFGVGGCFGKRCEVDVGEAIEFSVTSSSSKKFFRRIPWRKIGYYVLWFSGISYTCYNIIEHFTTYRTYPSIITQASSNSESRKDMGQNISFW